MLHLHYLRENRDDVIERLKVRNIDMTSLVDEIIKMDEDRRHAKAEMDNLLAESNSLAKQIGEMYKSGKADEAEALKKKSAEQKEKSHSMADKLTELEADIERKLVEIPNVPNPQVPSGNSEQDNEIIRVGGDVVSLPQSAIPHWELAEKYNLINFELGNKITGAGFPVYIGQGARLQRALINFFLDKALKAGYTEYQPPILVNEESAFATGQLPDKEGQMYATKEDPFYLIPTGEVPLTNMYRDTILKSEEMPVKIVGYTPCFRREAGSYGKDVRGLNRLHQFDKVEVVQLRHPDESYKTLDEMVAYVESLLQALELQYRVVKLCGGDLGFTSALTFDMEVFSGGQDRWLEVSSISNFESYQANRLKLRFKEDGTNKIAHTLNGSALALPRIVAALLENNQVEDGIMIPKALQPYTGFEKIIAE